MDRWPRRGRLLAISDLHVGFRENRELVGALRAEHADDWLIVAGDVAERFADIAWALNLLAQRFARVIWAPGNHELWTTGRDSIALRGEERYETLVELCRSIGVVTPEDPYPIWTDASGPIAIVPLFVLYDYSFRPDGAHTKEEALAQAYQSGVVCTDEALLHPDPHVSREAWCEARVKLSEQRLSELPPGLPTVLVNHYPLVREPTGLLRYQQFAMWCGTERTADWHLRFNATVVVYGHLHIRRTSWHDGVRFTEVSMGYPKERAAYGLSTGLCQILPYPAA